MSDFKVGDRVSWVTSDGTHFSRNYGTIMSFGNNADQSKAAWIKEDGRKVEGDVLISLSLLRSEKD